VIDRLRRRLESCRQLYFDAVDRGGEDCGEAVAALGAMRRVAARLKHAATHPHDDASTELERRA
jgi:hypothetical protein